MGIFNVNKFAAYISRDYLDKFHKTISPVRLQKSLYFCCAYWGGFVEKGKLQDKNKMEIDTSNYDKYLFDATFQAWVYGPVIPAVYNNNNIDSAYDENLFNGNDYIKDFIDDLLKDINDVSDFKLVDISHKDEAWINHFHYGDKYHNEEIPKDEIINEYIQK